MSTIKHIDKDIIVRRILSFPGDPMTLAQGGGYPLEQSNIDHIIKDGINCQSFGDLSDAFRLILQSVEGESNNIYEGLASEALVKLVDLIKEWSNDGAGNGCITYLADDCIEQIFSFHKTDLPDHMLSLPDGGAAFDLWDINKEENTATLSDGNGGTFLIEFHKNELDFTLENEEDFSDHTMGLEYPEETFGYFYSDDEIQYMMDDVKMLIEKINDIVRKYDDKYVLKLN